ncbi:MULTISPECIES: hypothetical protein [Streptomyces]|uniref:hypothetical protein n=1 Tax=Streptomyces TaxID=1883 RepID=UPI000A966449|nr:MULTISPECIES: hypothetical protein [Streptomyces]MDI5905311.1 hypothetical protein [Streptomyces sp. 12257]
MQTTRIGTSSKTSGRDLTPLLAGAATAIGGFGALLAFIGSDSPLRAPLTLFFLLAAPAAGIAAALRGFDPFARVLASLAGSVVLNMLVSQGMLATHRWSARGGVMAMAVISALILLLVLMWRRRAAKGQDA